MMPHLNKVLIMGHMGADPEIKYMPNGNAVANITVATTKKWKDKQTQEKQEATEWHRVTLYKHSAEHCGQYANKGSAVYVEGALRTRKWQDQDGTDRYTTEIIARDFQILPGSKENAKQQPAKPQQTVAEDFDDDIPF